MRADNYKSQGRGAVQSIGGRIKQAIGRFFGSERTHAEGRAEELRGQANVERGTAGERAGGKVEEVTGTMKEKIGEAVGSERMATEGRAKELEGQQRQQINR